MNLRLTIALVATLFSVLFGAGSSSTRELKTNPALEDESDIVAIAYNSHDTRSESFIFASVEANERASHGNLSTLSVGMGQHLWTIDEEGRELKRGWMFRLRLTMQAVIDEYNRRGQQDFIALVSDATDVYVSRSMDGNTIETLKHRFLSDFSDHKIVFSTQIYCCNPWDLRSIARKDWDEHFERVGQPSSIYKHLNAGLYMGYASAIIEMAEQMGLWAKDYHHHEAFHSLVGTSAEKDLHMKDLEVDDDEWQLTAWFFQDQTNQVPLSTLDFDQHLFTVTGTIRVQERDDGFNVFSRDYFRQMFGQFPPSFSFEDMGQLTVCPYEYDSEKMEWTGKISGGHPLIFHFAGNDWLCACTVFAAEGFQGPTGKFRDDCMTRYKHLYGRVQEAVQLVAHDEDTTVEIFLKEEQSIVSENRRRLKPKNESGSPKRGKGEDGGPYGPYNRLLRRKRGKR